MRDSFGPIDLSSSVNYDVIERKKFWRLRRRAKNFSHPNTININKDSIQKTVYFLTKLLLFLVFLFDRVSSSEHTVVVRKSNKNRLKIAKRTARPQATAQQTKRKIFSCVEWLKQFSCESRNSRSLCQLVHIETSSGEDRKSKKKKSRVAFCRPTTSRSISGLVNGRVYLKFIHRHKCESVRNPKKVNCSLWK